MADNTIKGAAAPQKCASVCDDIQNQYEVAKEQINAGAAILDAAAVLCSLERSKVYQDSHPSFNIRTGGGYAHGRRVFDSTLPTLLEHAHSLVSMALNDVDGMREDAIESLKGATVELTAEQQGNTRYEALLQRLHSLCDEGALVVSSHAGKPAADDARQFISWVAEQVSGVPA